MESSSSEKNLLRPLKITIFGPTCAKIVFPIGQAQKKKNNFFEEITKSDHKLSKTFYFTKIYVLADLCFSILCDSFLLKSVISRHNSCVCACNFDVISDLSKDFWGIPLSAENFRVGIQKDIILNFEEWFSVTNMYGWHG